MSSPSSERPPLFAVPAQLGLLQVVEDLALLETDVVDRPIMVQRLHNTLLKLDCDEQGSSGTRLVSLAVNVAICGAEVYCA
jgi:hypothetical protein